MGMSVPFFGALCYTSLIVSGLVRYYLTAKGVEWNALHRVYVTRFSVARAAHEEPVPSYPWERPLALRLGVASLRRSLFI